MNLITAIETLQGIADRAGSRAIEMHLDVVIFSPGSIGGTPKVPVKGISAGIDWDAQSVMLHVESEVTRLTAEQKAEIRESAQKGQSWHAYQQYKRQAERIKSLEDEIKALKMTITKTGQ